MHEIEKSNKLLKSYDGRLFCKWNDDFEVLEIWEHGTRGKDYLVKIIEQDGHCRPIDYKDIEGIHKRNIGCRQEGMIDEVDADNRDHKHYQTKSYRKTVRRISIDNFNQIMHNPVITGKIAINP